MIPEKTKSTTCLSLEGDMSAYVDGELEGIQAERVISHLYECPHCQGFVERIRDLAHLHRTCFNHEAVLEGFDPEEAFKGITTELLEEKIEKVAELFYQIGKAYLVKALHANLKRNVSGKKPPLHVKTRPISVESAKMKTGRLFREMEKLAKNSGISSRRHKRARLFFRSRGNLKTNYLELSRRFLEESLAVSPDRPEPRLCLGVYYNLGVRNCEQAREQFRKVLTLHGISEESRTEALINLGSAYNIECNYGEAVECFRQVAKSGVVKRHPRFLHSLIYLAITYVKLGDFDHAISTFTKTVKDFPKRVGEMRNALKEMRTFQNVMENQPHFRRQLKERLPVLFAS